MKNYSSLSESLPRAIFSRSNYRSLPLLASPRWCLLFLFMMSCYTAFAQSDFKCYTGDVNIEGEGFAPPINPPACWPDDNPPCEVTLNYAPDPNFPEHTPIKYVKFVLHVFQYTDPNPNPITVFTPGNFTNSQQHMDVLRSWFHHPSKGINYRLANLCDPLPKVPGNESPHIKDSRVRAIFDGIENQDVFFYDNLALWRGGLKCGIALHNTMFNVAVTTNPMISSNPNLRNAVHVFIAGASFKPATVQNPECLNYGGGGYTILHCGELGERVGIVIFGNFYSYHYNNTGQSPDGVAWTDTPPAPEDIPYGGNIILAEFLHMVSVDHPFGSSHLTGGDQCNDTPASQETPNNMMQTAYQQQLLHPSQRCALTECQLGRMHHFFEELNPI